MTCSHSTGPDDQMPTRTARPHLPRHLEALQMSIRCADRGLPVPAARLLLGPGGIWKLPRPIWCSAPFGSGSGVGGRVDAAPAFLG